MLGWPSVTSCSSTPILCDSPCAINMKTKRVTIWISRRIDVWSYLRILLGFLPFTSGLSFFHCMLGWPSVTSCSPTLIMLCYYPMCNQQEDKGSYLLQCNCSNLAGFDTVTLSIAHLQFGVAKFMYWQLQWSCRLWYSDLEALHTSNLELPSSCTGNCSDLVGFDTVTLKHCTPPIWSCQVHVLAIAVILQALIWWSSAEKKKDELEHHSLTSD